MDESELTNRVYSYSFYCAAVFFAVLAIASVNYVVIILCSMLLLLAGICLHSGYVLNNLLTKHSLVIQTHNEMKLDPSLLSLTSREKEYYRSVSIARMHFEGVATTDTESLKKLIESMQEPFSFSIRMAQVDKRRMLDSLDAKRRMKEIQITKLKPSKQDKSLEIRREIQVIEAEISGIRSSGKAFEAQVILTAEAEASTSPEAARQSLRSMERVCDAFSASTKLDYEILKGEELIAFGRRNL